MAKGAEISRNSLANIGYTKKTFNTEAQSARRKKKARFGEEFLCELLVFSPYPSCLRGEITFFSVEPISGTRKSLLAPGIMLLTKLKD